MVLEKSMSYVQSLATRADWSSVKWYVASLHADLCTSQPHQSTRHAMLQITVSHWMHDSQVTLNTLRASQCVEANRQAWAPKPQLQAVFTHSPRHRDFSESESDAQYCVVQLHAVQNGCTNRMRNVMLASIANWETHSVSAVPLEALPASLHHLLRTPLLRCLLNSLALAHQDAC